MKIFKKLTFAFCVFTLTSAWASDLICTTAINTNIISSVSVQVETGDKVVFEEVEGYKLMIKNFGNHKYEMEVFESDVPSRGYASGFLRNRSDELSWAKWSREILIETSCKLDEIKFH